MERHPDWPKVREALRPAVADSVGEAVRTLLQDKHLYQTVEVVSSKELLVELGRFSDLAASYLAFLNGPWVAFDPVTKAHAPGVTVHMDWIYFLLPTIRSFCTKCGERLPFNPVGVSKAPRFEKMVSISKEGAEQLADEYRPGALAVDVFILSYQCQGCKRAPEVFTVRRTGAKLTLCGRAPMEHVDVPKFIPKKEAHWLRGSIVAYQSGQELAALFLLRTFIEQFARRQVGAKTTNRGQDLMEEYGSKLPKELKSGKVPSLRKLYEEISLAARGKSLSYWA